MHYVGLGIAAVLILGLGYFLVVKRREDRSAGETRSVVTDSLGADHKDV